MVVMLVHETPEGIVTGTIFKGDISMGLSCILELTFLHDVTADIARWARLVGIRINITV